MSIALTVNNCPGQAPDGASALDAVNAAAVHLSRLCKDPDMQPVEACRTCLVEIEELGGFPASGTTPAREGMAVRTDSPEATRIRSGVLELTRSILPAAAPPSESSLPSASFAEKESACTNSERRVRRVRQAAAPVGQSRPDWEIIGALGRRMRRKPGLPLEEQFAYVRRSEIFHEMVRFTPVLAGVNYQRLAQEGGSQWPCPTPAHLGAPCRYADSFPHGPRSRFLAFEQGPLADGRPSRRYPLIRNTGRLLYHWHGGAITRRVPGLLARLPELEVSLNPADGAQCGVADGQLVQATYRRGKPFGRAIYTDRMRASEIFIPFVKLSWSAANFLTNSACDPDTMIPEYKVCAVRIEAAE